MHKKGESMKLTIHIEKKHAYFIVAGLVLLSSLIFVIGTGYTSGAFHETLFADIIRGKSSAAVQVQDDLTVSGNLGGGITSPTEKLDVDGNVKGTGLCIGTDCKQAWPATSSFSSCVVRAYSTYGGGLQPGYTRMTAEGAICQTGETAISGGCGGRFQIDLQSPSIYPTNCPTTNGRTCATTGEKPTGWLCGGFFNNVYTVHVT